MLCFIILDYWRRCAYYCEGEDCDETDRVNSTARQQVAPTTYIHSTCNGITHYYYYRHPSCQPVVFFDSVDVWYIMHVVNDIIYSTRIYYISIIIMYTILSALGWRTSIICVILCPQWMNIIILYYSMSVIFSEYHI